ncbi:hypothetical protein DSO57_1019284 [Entomophthora muscae]|uniref:Uncharacterized protein n=1 Tax=Entomophthora muscae TaxID=34485 RepID=A0ACC2RIM4_9FUNG|nr:hypothetical protein DSO57_1019284 [Entomophthora muscae]
MPTNLGVVPPVFENENLVVSQCPEFYSEDTLMLLQAIYLGLFWLGISFGNFTKQYLKPHWWLTINSMWIWVLIPHHLETASYYLAISVTLGTPMPLGAASSPGPVSILAPGWVLSRGSLNCLTPALVGGWGFKSPSRLLQLPALLLGGLVWGFEPCTGRHKDGPYIKFAAWNPVKDEMFGYAVNTQQNTLVWTLN